MADRFVGHVVLVVGAVPGYPELVADQDESVMLCVV